MILILVVAMMMMMMMMMTIIKQKLAGHGLFPCLFYELEHHYFILRLLDQLGIFLMTWQPRFRNNCLGDS